MSSEEQTQAVRERDSRYYLGLEEWMKDPQFNAYVESEFQSSPLREGSEKQEGWARREFLKLMGASLAMASAGCIRRPVQKIVPYNKQPEEVTFAVPNFYTSTWSDGSDVASLLVRTREGRPLKYEGLPDHPFQKGGLLPRAHAHLLSLYDPERLKNPVKKDSQGAQSSMIPVKWEDADDVVAAQLVKGQVALLTGNLLGPSARAVVGDFVKAFGARHYCWEPLNTGAMQKANEESFGTSLIPFYRFDKAKMIVSVDGDFLGTWLMPTIFQRQFSEGRKNPEGGMNQLVVFESGYSLTGANADMRFKIKPSQQLEILLGLAYTIVVKQKLTSYAGNPTVMALLEPFAQAPSNVGLDEKKWNQLASSLYEHRGQSLIVAGGLSTQHEGQVFVQTAVNFLNSLLGNDGHTLDWSHPLVGEKAQDRELLSLIESMEKGQIQTLIIHNQNVAYASPLASRFSSAVKKVSLIVYCGDRVDETGELAHYVLPDLHPMESWGDMESIEGLYHIHQPTIRPLYDNRSFGLTLMTWGYLTKKGSQRFTELETYYDYLRQILKEEVAPRYAKGRSLDEFWDHLLQKGFVTLGDPQVTGGGKPFNLTALAQVKKSPPVLGLELVPYATLMFKEGSLSNVSWLHELPDPVTKVCWDNYALISMALAEKLKVKQGQRIEILVGDQKVKLPVCVQPGLHEEVVAVAVGYGRRRAGQVGNGIGVDVYPLGQWKEKEGFVVFAGAPVSVKTTAEMYPLAAVQSHHAMEGRQIVTEATLAEYLKNKASGIHSHHIFSLWPGHQYNGNKWGMAVDLNSCTGCSSCMIACQAENNIPVVGKKYVLQGREMHWIRVDRYYVGAPQEAETVFQPVMCQHCDNAPCETVCPVLATVHSDDGLNDMAYNRCVGTRYCSNNCPYKVRRFNWFHYNKNIEKPLHLALNPEVTVRMRGVMEKCTFCVHRIKSKRIEIKNAGAQIQDGDIKTACQETCPTGAIVFGDLNDPQSKVSQIFKTDQRAYALLEEWHAAPSVRYMTKIRNNGEEKRHNESHH
jgi:MoCo/4Fe-4S cofactor protein with predicted Tat translocation signal